MSQANKRPIRSALGRSSGKKYILLGKESFYIPSGAGSQRIHVRLHRIQAVMDIPMWGVKDGDLGGYVSGWGNLSHEGSSWIADESIVAGKTRVSGDALVAEDSLIYSDYVFNFEIKEKDGTARHPRESIVIRDKSVMMRSRILGHVSSFSGTTWIQDTKIDTAFTVVENSLIAKDISCSGDRLYNKFISAVADSFLAESSPSPFGYNPWEYPNLSKEILAQMKESNYPFGISLKDTVPSTQGSHKYASDAAIARLLDGIRNNPAPEPKPKHAPAPKPLPVHSPATATQTIRGAVFTPAMFVADETRKDVLRTTLSAIEAEYESYVQDIVKLIKYPLMNDLGFAPTREFVHALRKARRVLETGTLDEIEQMIEAAEDKFLLAESEARTIATTRMDPAKLKKIASVETLISLASDENASKNEREISFKQVFKQLEGVIHVSDEARDAFRVSSGLLQIEA